MDHVSSITLAAGRIFIPVRDRDQALSGFWLEKDYFVTSANFLDWSDDHQTTVERLNHLSTPFAKASSLKFVPDSNRGKVSLQIDKNLHILTHADEDASLVTLLGINVESDLAIFRRMNSTDAIVPSIRLDQLEDVPQNPTPAKLFTVGYNGNDMRLELSPLDHNLKQNTTLIGHLSSTYRFLFDYYKFEILRRSQRGQKIFQGISNESQTEPPPFDSVYAPNQKAIAFGKTVSSTDNDIMDNDVRKPENEAALTVIRRHNISGFYGISGAMMVMYDDMNIESMKVVGLCKCATEFLT